MTYPQDPPSKRSNEIKQTQTEYQGLEIRNSTNIHVVQTELQSLLLVQASLQAALQVAILSLDDEEKTKKLQELSQSLEAAQIQAQSLVVDDCEGIAVSQTDLQIHTVVQAAIELLAKLSIGSS